jgi:hypothetical protein
LEAALGEGAASTSNEPGGENTPDQDAEAGSDGRSGALERGVDWLASSQRADGTWEEPQYTGTGFPSDYYINYHLYRLTFPIMALGRCLRATRGGRADSAADAAGNAGRGRASTVAVDGHRGSAEGAIDLCSIEAQTRCS